MLSLSCLLVWEWSSSSTFFFWNTERVSFRPIWICRKMLGYVGLKHHGIRWSIIMFCRKIATLEHPVLAVCTLYLGSAWGKWGHQVCWSAHCIVDLRLDQESLSRWSTFVGPSSITGTHSPSAFGEQNGKPQHPWCIFLSMDVSLHFTSIYPCGCHMSIVQILN